jgi:hypothetical protein
MPFLLVRLFNLRPRLHALIMIGAATLLIIVGGVVFAQGSLGSLVSLGVSDDPEVGPGDFLLLIEPNGYHGHRRHEPHAGHGATAQPGA